MGEKVSKLEFDLENMTQIVAYFIFIWKFLKFSIKTSILFGKNFKEKFDHLGIQLKLKPNLDI